VLTYALVLVVGYVAGTVSGIVGTGATIILLAHPGIRLRAARGRADHGGRRLDVELRQDHPRGGRRSTGRACAAYALGGIPAAALGARTLLILPERLIDIALGLFLPTHGARPPAWLATRNLKFGFWHLAVAGAVIGFLTGVVVSTGPLSVPAFAAYGLVKGAFIATEAAGSLALYISKALTFRQFGALPLDIPA